MSECGFCISVDIECPLSDYRCVLVTASIAPFKCHECDRQFPAGSPVELATGDPDEDGVPLFSVETCADCHYIADAFCCDGRLHGSLWANMDDAFDETTFSEACLAEVETASAKAYLVERWRKWKSL